MSILARFILLLLVAMSWATARAQNLVVNGSFEEYTECPPSFGYWASVEGWTSPYTQSADYFNACATNIACSVPLNDLGFQHAAHGRAYMGIVTAYVEGGGYHREVIATQLTEPLQPGVPVYCSFKVSPGGFGVNPVNSVKWAAKGPGMNFFSQLPQTSQPWLFSEWTTYLFPNSAVVDMPGVLNDTSVWVNISASFVPDSAYEWLAIMNFYENNLSMPELLDINAIWDVAYAFIDDVCVSYDPTYCDMAMGVHSQAPCDVRVSPNPFTDALSLTCEVAGICPNRGTLIDLQGRICWSETWPVDHGTWNIGLDELPPAMYILALDLSDGTRKSMRVVRSPNL